MVYYVLVLELDGEVIQRADPILVCCIAGTEKLAEHKTYLQAFAVYGSLQITCL